MYSLSTFKYLLPFILLGTSLAPTVDGFTPQQLPLRCPSIQNAPCTSSPSSASKEDVSKTTTASKTTLNLSTRANEPPTKIKNPLTTLSSKYTQLTQDHYLVMAFLQAGFLASSADIATQTMEGASPVYYGHVAAMAMVASTMSGATNAVWLRQLEAAFPGTGTKEVFTKTMIHAVILASIINSAYLVGVPLFSTYFFPEAGGSFHLPPMDLDVLFQGWSIDEFWTLTKLEVCMFIPYNTLAFKFVPPSIRPLTHAAISATFNVAVSAVTLGYFDVWVERALRTVGH